MSKTELTTASEELRKEISDRLPMNTEVEAAINDKASLSGDTFPGLIRATAGINFNASGGDTLSDYEVGTWSPSLAFTNDGDAIFVGGTATGRYFKIGNLCAVDFLVETEIIHSTADGEIRVTEIPFETSQGVNLHSNGMIRFQGITKPNYTQIGLFTLPSSTYFSLRASGSGQTTTTVGATDIPTDTNFKIYGSLIYRTA